MSSLSARRARTWVGSDRIWFSATGRKRVFVETGEVGGDLPLYIVCMQ